MKEFRISFYSPEYVGKYEDHYVLSSELEERVYATHLKLTKEGLDNLFREKGIINLMTPLLEKGFVYTLEGAKYTLEKL